MDGKKQKYFPDYFEDSAQIEIRKWGTNADILVYRVGKYGKNDSTAFLNYYEEAVKGLKPIRRNKEQYLEKCRKNIDSLSVSCYEKKEDIEDYYKITLKDTYPARILLHGRPASDCGLSCRTKERKENYTNSHVDWWLFQDSQPWKHFEEVEV